MQDKIKEVEKDLEHAPAELQSQSQGLSSPQNVSENLGVHQKQPPYRQCTFESSVDDSIAATANAGSHCVANDVQESRFAFDSGSRYSDKEMQKLQLLEDLRILHTEFCRQLG